MKTIFTNGLNRISRYNNQFHMRTKLCRLVLTAICLAGVSARAQDNVPAPRTGDTSITLDKMAAVSSNPLGVRTNREPVIVLDSEANLGTAVQILSDQAGLRFRYAPELAQGGKSAAVLAGPVGEGRFEQTSAYEALQRLARRNGLVIGRYANSPDVVIGTAESQLTPVQGGGGGDLDPGPDAESFGAFTSDPTMEIPLQTAILMLARHARMPVVLDPRLRTGYEISFGTNAAPVRYEPITNATVNLGAMVDRSAKQRLQAVLNAHNLTMVQDSASDTYTITFKEPGTREPMVPNVVQLRYSNTTNIQDLLQTTFPSARVRPDTRTASLLIMSTEKDFESITNLIAKLDTPTAQVLIEARFLETLQNPRSAKGVDWTATLQANRVTFGNGTLGGDSSAPHPNTAQIDTRTESVTSPRLTENGRPGVGTVTTRSGSAQPRIITTSEPDNPFLSASKYGFNAQTAFLNAQGVNAVLSALNSDEDTRTLATPRAVTLDNQETRLEVTRAIPIFNASEGIGQAGVTVSSVRPEYTNVGTILIVTPRISGTNIAMRVRPEISDVEPRPSQKLINDRINEADIFSSTKIDTQVLIPSGNTLVMGGLVRDSNTKVNTKVPILGDIPGLGRLFRHESQNRSKRNLLIFVTPTIISNEDFQPYRTDFLNTPMPEHPTLTRDPKDSAKPRPMTKKAKAEAESRAKVEAQMNAGEPMRME